MALTELKMNQKVDFWVLVGIFCQIFTIIYNKRITVPNIGNFLSTKWKFEPSNDVLRWFWVWISASVVWLGWTFWYVWRYDSQRKPDNQFFLLKISIQDLGNLKSVLQREFDNHSW